MTSGTISLTTQTEKYGRGPREPSLTNYRVYHAKLDIRKRWHSAFKSAKIDLKKRFKEHTSSGFLCKNFMSLGQIF